MNFRIAAPDPAARSLGASTGGAVHRDRAADLKALKKSAEAMEGLFVQQLFQAMRAGVPSDGLVERGAGEDLFTSLLDQKVSEEVAERSSGPSDLSSSLFDALRHRLGAPADTAR